MSYSYSPWHRALEILGICAMFVFMSLLSHEVWGGVHAHPGSTWWVVFAGALAGVIWADFISGLFHFLADNFGSEDMPLLGPNVIRPFREHHVDPLAITRHDFIETNGNNSLICLPTIAGVYFLVPAQHSAWALTLDAFTVAFMIAIFATNQFHKWSHAEARSGWVLLLQRLHLVLPKDHHQVHHTAPFDRYYCITTGWLNPVLERVGFFPRLYALLKGLGLPPSDRLPRDLGAVAGAGVAPAPDL